MNDLFSERNGLISSIANVYTAEFRSAIVTSFFNQYDTSLENNKLFGRLNDVMDLFGIEQKPQSNEGASLLENKRQTLLYFKSCEWNRLFDFIEYVLTVDKDIEDALIEKYNQIFRLHGCRYRLINGRVVPIVNELEIQQIKKAINTGVDGTDRAYNEALALFSNRTNPDYNAVIAKASNAFEAMVVYIARENGVSENTLGKAITELESNGVVFNDDMKAIIKKLYSYACNSGIRHGGTNPVIAKEEDAILVLVISAAAINYLNYYRLDSLSETGDEK